MSNFNRKKNYTVDNIECIGPCVPAGIGYLHPILLKFIISNEGATCPTNLFLLEDGSIGSAGYCDNADCDNFNLSDMMANSVIPSIGMEPKVFLSLIYNIKSFEDAIEWIDSNNNNVYDTYNRILDCAWLVYIKEIPNIKIPFIEFYRKFTKKYWTEYILQKTKITNNEFNKLFDDDLIMEKIVYNSFRKLLYEYSGKEIQYNQKMKKHIKHYVSKYRKS